MHTFAPPTHLGSLCLKPSSNPDGSIRAREQLLHPKMIVMHEAQTHYLIRAMTLFSAVLR